MLIEELAHVDRAILSILGHGHSKDPKFGAENVLSRNPLSIFHHGGVNLVEGGPLRNVPMILGRTGMPPAVGDREFRHNVPGHAFQYNVPAKGFHAPPRPFLVDNLVNISRKLSCKFRIDGVRRCCMM